MPRWPVDVRHRPVRQGLLGPDRPAWVRRPCAGERASGGGRHARVVCRPRVRSGQCGSHRRPGRRGSRLCGQVRRRHPRSGRPRRACRRPARRTVLFLIVPRQRLRGIPAAQVVAVAVLLVTCATAVSAAVAVQMFRAWPCSQPTGVAYAMPGVAQLSFSSPETREVAQQVKPFTDKNLDRIRDEASPLRTCRAGQPDRAARRPA